MKVREMQTKSDFQNLMLEILNPLKPYYSDGKANLRLGVTAASYDEKAISMESFSRPLWALVPFFAGGGKDEWFETAYQYGFANGADPESGEHWGTPGEYDQRFVEMAAIGYALLYAGETFWDGLSPEAQIHLAAYLYTINEHALPDCNWHMFRVLVNAGLKKVGKPYDTERMEESLKQIESYYLGDGWYRDGDSGQKDYYISFAIHFYCLLYAREMEKEDQERCLLFKKRAMIFAKQFIYWFDEDGAAIPFGRSLTYRFAQVSFFSACIVAGIEPFPLSVLKGLIVRHLEYWLNQPIFDRNGILTIGYAYPNLIMAERYNGPGSPYWSMKSFAILMLPEEHPFWSVKAAPFPAMPDSCPMPRADMLVRRYPHHVTAYVPGVYSPNGHGQITAKYGKFAYDTRFGFSVAKSCYELHENCPDSMLAFLINGYVYVRRICEASEIREQEVWSRWSPYPGIWVETTIIPLEEGHQRIHQIDSKVACVAYDCGFSVAAGLADGICVSQEGSWCRAENHRMVCQVESLTGNGEGCVIDSDPNTNLLYPKTVLPGVKYQIEKGKMEAVTRVAAGIKTENRKG